MSTIRNQRVKWDWGPLTFRDIDSVFGTIDFSFLSCQNDMIGPRGFGAANFVALDREYIYKIRFENDVNATAPAQRVVVTTQLNEHIRAQSFRLV